ncbi:S-adenosyl-L-methionine-dependent methyltransferase [Lasiosphaeria miniovina]|uniref:S-adenosyl-L-methionine-dependent methyltransferase n=1 Tax=Lasiosphaeria miniovina TaxID=1954250 RepID=A0AA40E200_9PEZI|nr:S-adenosyl-L-methionine-dependent methyltransferase [Lasiosphaeria miniovina]KAK0722047.1 S-adenosyl-L-methionine-dependent methyltransferase [Lasiosphaeria miniovina]
MEQEEVDNADADSSLGDDVQSSTASISSSILEYRAIQGRTFHSARHPTEYFTPNDDRQQESVDLTHHYLTVILDGKLFLAPISEDPKKVLDIGTGTGIWAIDFADMYPGAEVIGTDLSPMQPTWVPPNMIFEIDDATLPWTWSPNTFDFVHIRYLFGTTKDWTALFKQAYRVLQPGSWLQSGEIDVDFKSDDGTTDDVPGLATWGKLFAEAGKVMGTTFYVVAADQQRKSMEEAGFTDINVATFKVPVGGWALDPKLAEVGRIVHATLENDMEGYTLMLWHNVLQWPKDEYQIFLMEFRKAIRNKRVHGYMTLRYVYGRKPE